MNINSLDNLVKLEIELDNLISKREMFLKLNTGNSNPILKAHFDEQLEYFYTSKQQIEQQIINTLCNQQ